jgi:hypothetical protein
MELDKWLDAKGMTQGEFGRLLTPAKTQGQISHYITGHTPIPLEVAAQMEEITDGEVCIVDWVGRQKRTAAA